MWCGPGAARGLLRMVSEVSTATVSAMRSLGLETRLHCPGSRGGAESPFSTSSELAVGPRGAVPGRAERTSKLFLSKTLP